MKMIKIGIENRAKKVKGELNPENNQNLGEGSNAGPSVVKKTEPDHENANANPNLFKRPERPPKELVPPKDAVLTKTINR